MRRTLKLCDFVDHVPPPPVNMAAGGSHLFAPRKKLPSGPVYLQEHENVFALSCVLLADRHGRAMEQSSNPYTSTFPVPGLQRRAKREVLMTRYFTPTLPEALWFVDRSYPNYWHWLCESLPRLFLARRAGVTAPLILPRRIGEVGFAMRVLEVMGEEPLFTGRKIGFFVKKLYVPEHPSHREFSLPSHNHEVINDFAEFIKERVGIPDGPMRKIYVSRARAARRRIIGEEAVIDLLRRHGYEDIYLEELDFKEQVRTLAKTSHLVSLHGAGLANMMFMPPGGRVMEILHPRNTSLIFRDLALAKKADYYALLGEQVVEPGKSDLNSDVKVEVSSFSSELDAFDKNDAVRSHG